MASFSRITCLVTLVKEWFEDKNKESEILTSPQNCLVLSPIKHLRDVLDKQVISMEAPSTNLQDFKDVPLMAWCQIPQHTLRGLVEPMGQGFFGSKGGGVLNISGHNVMATGCM